jgi:antitoxin component of RelBE/YafQ-DinJ toxin-antitoxin module
MKTIPKPAKTVVSFKIRKDVRDRARLTAARLGLPLSTVVDNYLRQFSASRYVEFRDEGTPRPVVVKEVLKDLADMEKGKNTSPMFTNMEDAIRWLNR